MLINTSHWKRDYKSQASGTRRKFWLNEPNDGKDSPTKYLFKIPNEGTGGHWAEFIASKLGAKLGFNVADVYLAENNGIIGIISRNFLNKSEELFESGDLFSSRFENFNRHSLDYYEIENIIEILKPYDLNRSFVLIPLFDALIANNDRHCDNWGVIVSVEEVNLAPIYDNGSSLGFNVTEEQKIKMLSDKRMLKGFCNRGRPCIGLSGKRKPKHMELLSYLNYHFPEEIERGLNSFNKINEGMLNTIVKDIPSEIMDNITKQWIIRLLMFRKYWLLDWYERTEES